MRPDASTWMAVYDWYEKHASLKSQSSQGQVQTERSASAASPSPWIFIKRGEAQPPGSLRRPRSAAATFGSGQAPPGLPRAVSAPNLSESKPSP